MSFEPIEISEYTNGVGGFTAGLENSSLFRVKNVANLSKVGSWSYNNIHHDLFDFTFDSLNLHNIPTRLIIFHLIKEEDLFNFRLFLAKMEYTPECIVVIGDPKFLLNYYADNLVETHEDFPTDNEIAVLLHNNGFDVHRILLDEATFGVPQHKECLLTLGFDKPLDVNIFDNLNKLLSKTTTVWDAISDLQCLNIYNSVSNEYQNFCRMNVPKYQNLSWQEIIKVRKQTSEKISMVPSNSSLSSLSEYSHHNGYIRLPKDEVANSLNKDFISVTSRSYSIHPVEDRLISIREACRLFGLTDQVTFDKKYPIKDIAECIYNSYSPLLGYAFADVLWGALNK